MQRIVKVALVTGCRSDESGSWGETSVPVVGGEISIRTDRDVRVSLLDTVS